MFGISYKLSSVLTRGDKERCHWCIGRRDDLVEVKQASLYHSHRLLVQLLMEPLIINHLAVLIVLALTTICMVSWILLNMKNTCALWYGDCHCNGTRALEMVWFWFYGSWSGIVNCSWPSCLALVMPSSKLKQLHRLIFEGAEKPALHCSSSSSVR